MCFSLCGQLSLENLPYHTQMPITYSKFVLQVVHELISISKYMRQQICAMCLENKVFPPHSVCSLCIGYKQWER